MWTFLMLININRILNLHANQVKISCPLFSITNCYNVSLIPDYSVFFLIDTWYGIIKSSGARKFGPNSKFSAKSSAGILICSFVLCFTLKICFIHIYHIHKKVCIAYLNIRKLLSVTHFDSVWNILIFI